MERMEITNGPSEMRLMMSLFREAVGGVALIFEAEQPLEDGAAHATALPVTIESLGRLHKDDQNVGEWEFTATVLNSAHPMRLVKIGEAKGQFNTRTRKGWLDLDLDISLDEWRYGFNRH